MSPSAMPASAAAADLVFEFQALGSRCSVQLPGSPAPELVERAAVRAAIAEVRRIEQKYSRYRADSLLSRINASAGSGEWVSVDDETADLLDFCTQAHAASGGLFDISTGVLRRAWNFSAPTPALPPPELLQALLELVGWDGVEWQRPWVRLPHRGMELDFGGFGKEYAADRAASVLHEAGVAAALVNLGGDLRVLGPRPDGRPWVLGVAHPRHEGRVLAGLEVHRGALATSGDYERYFELDGRRYCHILHPASGQPVSHWQSVSVLAPACLAAGVLATVAMLSGEGALPFLREQGVEFLAVDHAGRLHDEHGPCGEAGPRARGAAPGPAAAAFTAAHADAAPRAALA